MRYDDMPWTARRSGANCEAIRPFTSTIFAVPSACTKNSMLNSESSNPSAGMSPSAISPRRSDTRGDRALG